MNTEADAHQKLILTEISRLQSQLAGLEEDSQPIKPSVSLGRLTRMDAIQSKNVSEAALGASQKRIKELQSALERIENGTYTQCSQCGKEIGRARLEYMPETDRCVNCA